MSFLLDFRNLDYVEDFISEIDHCKKIFSNPEVQAPIIYADVDVSEFFVKTKLYKMSKKDLNISSYAIYRKLLRNSTSGVIRLRKKK